MKKTIVICTLALTLNGLSAKDSPLALGYVLSDKAGNFGIGLEITSPSLLDGFLSFRAESELEWLSGAIFMSDENISWEMYSSHKIGVVGTGGFAAEIIKLYGEFGGICVIPNSRISNDNYQLGIYGLFGFDFFMKPGAFISYFIETGSTGVFAGADKLAGSPAYLNGWTTSTGIRIHL